MVWHETEWKLAFLIQLHRSVWTESSSIAFSKVGWTHGKCDKPAQGNPSCICPAQRVSLLQVQKARPVGAGCLLFTFELRDLLRMHSPGHIALQRGSFLKHFSSCAVAQILVALSHSCLLRIQHHSLLLLPSGLDSSYLNQTPHVYLCCLLQIISRQGLQFRHQRVQWPVWKLFSTLLMNC